MRNVYIVLLCTIFVSACSTSSETMESTAVEMKSAAQMAAEAASDVETITKYQSTITSEELAGHLYFFASDYFEGRETTTRGQKLAAGYLAAEYRKMGLEPIGNDGRDSNAPDKFFQEFEVYGKRLNKAELSARSGLSTLVSAEFSADSYDDGAFLVFGNATSAEGPLYFAGYGIPDDDLGFNEITALESAGIDYSDGWLMILDGEPMRDDDESLLPTEDGGPSQWSQSRNAKLRAYFSSGKLPKGIVLVSGDTDASSFQKQAAAAAAQQQAVGSLSLTDDAPSRPFPPIYTVTIDVANEMLGPSGNSVASAKEQIDSTLEPFVFAVSGVTVSSTLDSGSFSATTENVVAFIEGTDPVLKDEVVVFSSHYDHIGLTGAIEGDSVNNGADDDGSGTVTLLEIAEAFMAAKEDGVGPRRSLIFLNVTGEEKGLLGSAHYADEDPRMPLDKTVANLNIDMIGRFDPTHPGADNDYVYIIGSKMISQELHDINVWANTSTGINLDLNERFNSKDDPNRFYARSDHWNFGKHNIPFTFYFTGTHEDYHGPGDEAHKVEYDRMARIGQLIFATGWRVANQDSRPAVSGEGFN